MKGFPFVLSSILLLISSGVKSLLPLPLTLPTLIPTSSPITSCTSLFNNLAPFLFDTACVRNVPYNYAVCDLHCRCIHGANFGNCIDWPSNMTVPLVVSTLNLQMCTCDYQNPRPTNWLPLEDTADPLSTCTTFLASPLGNTVSAQVCSVTLGAVAGACQYDCVCVHGFPSGSCQTDICHCDGIGPLNWSAQPIPTTPAP